MSKAILVLENMPKSCWECPVAHLDYEFCEADKRTRYGKRGIEKSLELKNRPDWCPLKECPKPIEYLGVLNEPAPDYRFGWNDCLEEILGEVTDNE